jgi:hypothetical protein
MTLSCNTKMVLLIMFLQYLHTYVTTYKLKQGDQKVYVHLFLYCNRQVHRDFLITLYKRGNRSSELYLGILLKPDYALV